MTSDRGVDHRVRTWLKTDRGEDANRLLNAVLDQLDDTPQRRHWWSARRPTPMTHPMKLGVAMAALALAAVAGWGAYLQVASGPSLSDPPFHGEVPAGAYPAGPLEPGLWAVGHTRQSLPVEVTFEVPEGWLGDFLHPGVTVVARDEPYADYPAENQRLIFGGPIQGVVTDACSAGYVRIGGSPSEVVEALAAIEGLEASAAREVEVDGYRGMQLTLYGAPGNRCPTLFIARIAGQDHRFAEGWVSVITVVDVEGSTVLFSMDSPPGATDDQRAELQRIFDSVQLEPNTAEE